jgi:DNA invertase Pin-like site-specific DNA recombinase
MNVPCVRSKSSTPSGEMMASVLATFAQFERRLIGQRPATRSP